MKSKSASKATAPPPRKNAIVSGQKNPTSSSTLPTIPENATGETLKKPLVPLMQANKDVLNYSSGDDSDSFQAPKRRKRDIELISNDGDPIISSKIIAEHHEGESSTSSIGKRQDVKATSHIVRGTFSKGGSIKTSMKGLGTDPTAINETNEAPEDEDEDPLLALERIANASFPFPDPNCGLDMETQLELLSSAGLAPEVTLENMEKNLQVQQDLQMSMGLDGDSIGDKFFDFSIF